MKQFAIDATKRIIKENLDNKNIIKLTDEYLARPEYSHLKQYYNHAKWLIDAITDRIASTFDPFLCNYSQQIQLKYTDIMITMTTKRFTDKELESLHNQSLVEVCLFSEGWEPGITKCFEDRNLSQEDPAQYKEFVIEVTRNQILKITQEIRNDMSHVVIYGGDDRENSGSNTRFTDKFSKRTVSFVDEVRMLNKQGSASASNSTKVK
jgi:hypothetical protein